MMYGLSALLDPDTRYSSRKPQFATLFDPRWRVAMYHGFGPIGRPYLARGVMPFALDGGTLVNTIDGPTLRGSGGGASVLTGNVSFSPSTIAGTFILTFRAVSASSSPATGNSHALTAQQYGGGTWIIQTADDFVGTLNFGWFNNGTDSRVNISNAGLWASGDLVTIGFSYSGLGTRAYVKGKNVASTGTAPSTFDTRTTGGGLNWGIGEDPNNGSGTRWGHDILNAVILDRALNDQEWGFIQQNPLNWPFLPDTEFNADLLLANVAVPITQTAVSMM